MTNTANNGFEIFSYSTIGFGWGVGEARTLTEAKAAAEKMTVRPGVVLVVRSLRSGMEYALVRGTWVRNPSGTDIIAATTRIDAAYARNLWTSLAYAAADAGKLWTRVDSDGFAYSFTDRTSF